jgi:hypothetical protein
MARQEVPPQQVDAGDMRMMNNALWIPERAVELQLRLCVETHCRSAVHKGVRIDAWLNQGVYGMDNDGQGCQSLCAELFALCGKYSSRQSATKLNEILHFYFLYTGLSRDGKYQYLLLIKDGLSGYLWLVTCRTADAAATVVALMRWLQCLVSCCYEYRTEAATSRTKWYNEHRRNSRPSIVLLRRIARCRTTLSSPPASKSYGLFVQCYQS